MDVEEKGKHVGYTSFKEMTTRVGYPWPSSQSVLKPRDACGFKVHGRFQKKMGRYTHMKRDRGCGRSGWRM